MTDFHEIWFFRIFQNLAPKKIKFHENLTRISKYFTWRIFMKFDFSGFFKIWPPKKSNLMKIWQELVSTLHEDLCTFMIITRSILLWIRNVSDVNSRREKSKTHVSCSLIFFPPQKSCAVYKIMWKHIVQPDRLHMSYAAGEIRFACWTAKSRIPTHAHNSCKRPTWRTIPFFIYIYFNSLHVSSAPVLIIRRISCINMTSAICHCM